MSGDVVGWMRYGEFGFEVDVLREGLGEVIGKEVIRREVVLIEGRGKVLRIGDREVMVLDRKCPVCRRDHLWN